MSSLIILGAQWGDEGKGKFVDYFSAKSDWAVRYNGGNNAGHTLVVNGVKTKLALVPSGALHPGVKCLIAAGVVLNPKVLSEELHNLRKAGVKIGPERLFLDREASLVLPHHVAIDLAREELKGKNKIGTTGRGIGPAYEERAARTCVRVAELLALENIKENLMSGLDHANDYLKFVLKSDRQVAFAEVWEILERARDEFSGSIANGSLLIENAYRAGEKIVFEGAQGTFLDINFGTYPFVTSSHTITGGVLTGCGIGPQNLGHIIGICKAYTTRVGSGPFPTELHDSVGERIREQGAEFGTITGRPRRCGWFDAMLVRRSVRLNGLKSLVLTKLDVLSGLPELKICTGYKLNGKALDDLPALASQIDNIEPVYSSFPGWSEDITGARKLSDLPAQAQNYLRAIEELIACKLSIISVSPERAGVILCDIPPDLKEYL